MALTLALAQINLIVGDIAGNTTRIIAAIQAAEAKGANLIIFPELSITSYPPEDLVLRSDFLNQVESAIDIIASHSTEIDVLVGFPSKVEDQLFNSAVYLRNGAILKKFDKRKLPNYGVFDEARYFSEGKELQDNVVELNGIKLGLLICEDIWYSTPSLVAKQADADIILVMNASPYSTTKHQQRLDTLRQRISETNLPIVYLNQVGGQDELLFDGDSMVMDSNGALLLQSKPFCEDLYYVKLIKSSSHILHIENITAEELLAKPTSSIATLYEGLVTAVRDYVCKNHFKGVVLGLSGGIDSALTLAIAVDALGKNNVQAVMMPSDYTANMSLEDAEWEAKTLGVDYQIIPIMPLFKRFQESLTPLFTQLNKTNFDKTEENLQARIRGNLLMAISNKTGRMLLTTSNKSEIAVGYATLYGDMSGGFSVIKDIYKTMVFELARYRNSISVVIPERVITRPPSAELAPNQTDQDSLPSYEILDQIIELFVEHDLSIDEIVAKGFDRSTVESVVRLIFINEYKRRQAAPGPRVTERAFGRNRRYPITSGFNPSL